MRLRRRVMNPAASCLFYLFSSTAYCLLFRSCRLALREDDGGGCALGAAALLHVAPPELALRAVGEHAERDEAAGRDVRQHLLHPPRAVEDEQRVDDDERDAELRRP